MYNTAKVKPAPTSLVGNLQPEVQGQGHRAEQPDPDRRRRALPVETQVVAGDQGPVRADEAAVRRDDSVAEAAAAADQEVLGPRVRRGRASSRTATRRSAPRGRSRRAMLRKPRSRCKELIPKEGATGWLDTGCSPRRPSTRTARTSGTGTSRRPKVQALAGDDVGETPVNKLACRYMNKLVKGSCATYHANEPEAYYASIRFWKTPLADCGNGKKDCMDYFAVGEVLERGHLPSHRWLGKLRGGADELPARRGRGNRRRLAAIAWRRPLASDRRTAAAARRLDRRLSTSRLSPSSSSTAFWTLEPFIGRSSTAGTPDNFHEILDELGEMAT